MCRHDFNRRVIAVEITPGIIILAIEIAAIESMSACADGGFGVMEMILAIGMVVMGSMFVRAEGGWWEFPLGGKGLVGMVVGLVMDVVGDAIEMIRADAKGSVATLPFEEFSGPDGVGYKVGGATFDGFHEV